MKRGQVSYFLRQLRLIYLTDWVRFYIQKYKNRKVNRDFKKQHPDVKLPPDYLIYESFQLNYWKYYTDSENTAKWIAGNLQKHIELQGLKMLDWGCGPGRVIRHLPSVIGNGCEYFGTDYNSKSIAWCSENLPGITFNNNKLAAELPYPDNFFGALYGISIFTHLSEALHYEWYKELYRVLQPGGIMLLTTQGDNFIPKLTESELDEYKQGKLIVRGKVKEGHRTYSAFHPKPFMNRLFSNADVVEHIEPVPEEGKALPQDAWIIKKKIS